MRLRSSALWLLGIFTFARVAGAEPSLVVLVSIDQMRADYLERFKPFFGSDGFLRLLRGGVVYPNCHYRYAMTATAPGHATLATGVTAQVHGIVANEWYDPAARRLVNSVEDSSRALIGTARPVVRTPGGVMEALGGAGGISPHRLLAPTVGDSLKQEKGASSKVFAISNKDRAGVLMGGKNADGVYWMHEGGFVTSRYYRDRLPEWVEAFNREGRIDASFGSTWDRLIPAEHYDRIQGPDAAPGEEVRLGLGSTFPRQLNGGAERLGKSFYEAYRLAPASTELLVDFAERLLVEEKLGQGPGRDLFCIGFSQLDYVGHSFGPNSHEVMDVVLRLDHAFARLLRILDQKVGEGRYVVVLCADHGVAPLPESVSEGARLNWTDILRDGSEALAEAYGLDAGGAYLTRDAHGAWINPSLVEKVRASPEDIAQVVARRWRARPEVAEVWTRSEILQGKADGARRWGGAVRLSFHDERSADLVIVVRPHVVDRAPQGTNHGTPYDYDNHVPLVVYRGGTEGRMVADRVTPEQVAPTLARLLGIAPPPQAAQPVLPGVFPP